jgi:uncharacterized membrane protein (DUF485 family)
MAGQGREERNVGDAASPASRWGLWLFALYLAAYGVFVGLNAFRPDAMEATVAGVNLAIVYGLGLIAGAFVLALVYAAACRGRGGSS